MRKEIYNEKSKNEKLEAEKIKAEKQEMEKLQDKYLDKVLEQIRCKNRILQRNWSHIWRIRSRTI